MSLDKAVALVVEYVRKTGQDQTKAISLLWNKRLKEHLGTELIIKLAKEGLRERVRKSLTNGVAFPSDDQMVSVMLTGGRASTAPQYITVSILERVTYDTLEGEKPIINFKDADFEYNIQRNDQQIEGLQRLNVLFRNGQQLLVKHHVEAIKDLPVSVRAEYAEEWEHIRIIHKATA